jgi:hypothetical protein
MSACSLLRRTDPSQARGMLRMFFQRAWLLVQTGQIDSKKIKSPLDEFLAHENRFAVLKRLSPQMAGKLQVGPLTPITRWRSSRPCCPNPTGTTLMASS